MHNLADINQTYIIETINTTGSTSACTTIYTTAITNCSGDTTIYLNNGIITFDGHIYTNNNISANTVNASTIISGGTNIIDLFNSKSLTGGTFNNSTDTLTLKNNDNSTIIVTGFTDYYTTGSTVIGNTIYFNRNDQLSAYTVNLPSTSIDVYSTGLTFSNNQLIITRNDGNNFNTFINTFSGLTINGILNSNIISANTISATTYYGDGSNLLGISSVIITGGTVSGDTLILNNSTGGTISISGFSTGTSSSDTYITGGTTNNSTKQYAFVNNTGGTFVLNGLTDVYVTGGTFGGSMLSLVNTTGGTIYITGFSTGTSSSDTYVTGGTYNNNIGIATFTNNTGGTFNISGFSTGSTSSTIITGTTNQINVTTTGNVTTLSLPSNIHLAGSIFVGGTSSLQFGDNGIGGSVTGFIGGVSDGVFRFGDSGGGGNPKLILGSVSPTLGVTLKRNGAGLQIRVGDDSGYGSFTAQTISATTYLNLPSDLNITGGTYLNGSLTLNNTTGGTIIISGFSTGTSSSDTYITGGTTNNSTKQYTFVNNTGGTFVINGLTDISIVDGSYSGNSVLLTNNTGGTITITGLTDYYTTGATLNNGIIYFNRNDQLSAYTVSLSSFTSNSTIVTGVTFSNNNLYLLNSSGGTYNTLIDNFSGLTVTGFSNTGTTRIVESNSGGTLSATKEIIDTFISDSNLISQLQTSSNWFGFGSGVPLNAPTGITVGYQGQWYIGGISGIPYLFFCKTDGIWIRESLTDLKQLQEGGTGANLSGTTLSGIITMNSTGNSLTNSGLLINQSLRTTDSPTFVNITATLLQLSSLLRLTPGTPTTITNTTNNWNTGSASAIQRISSSSATTITGLLAGSTGDLRFFTNTGSFNMTFTHEDTNSTAANRFSFSNNSNIILNTGCSITMYYDGTTAKWRDLMSNAASSASNKYIPARTPINDINYTVLSTDYLIAYTNLTTGRTMTLPLASNNTFKTYVAKDESGSAATFNITISGGSNTIDGVSTKIINSNYGSFEIYSNGVNYFTK